MASPRPPGTPLHFVERGFNIEANFESPLLHQVEKGTGDEAPPLEFDLNAEIS